MTYQGVIKNGVVVIDERIALPDGTPVRIEPMSPEPAASQTKDGLAERLLQFAGRASGLPAELARNHDHYLHGHPHK